MKVKNFMKKLSALALGLGMTLGVVSGANSNRAHEVNADTSYTKVTSISEGDYLIVNETSSRAWSGVDSTNSYVDVTITDGVISDSNGAAVVEIKAMTEGYSLKVTTGQNAGNYIYSSGTSNGLSFGSTEKANAITIADGEATILYGSTSFRYNAQSGQDRFRYYKTSTTGANYILPALYKAGSSTPPPSGTTYTVSFNTMGHGTAIADKEVAENGLVTAPTEPTDSGYDFVGWYKDSSLTNAWNFSTDKVTKDTELFAKWVVKAPAGDESSITFSFTSQPSGWPSGSSSSANSQTYTVGGNTYTFSLGANVYYNTQKYLMLKATTYLGLPAVEGHKLTKVVAKNSSSCSQKTDIGVSSSDSSASYISGGGKQTWSTQSGTYTYTLSETQANTVYYLYITSANAQITSLELTYEKVPTPVLQSIVISGQPTTKSYAAGQKLNVAGLVATGSYNFGDNQDLTNEVTWTVNPETLSAGTTSCNVVASLGTVTSQAYQVTGLTVVAPKALDSITVDTTAHRTFNVGDSFVKETVTAHYDDEDTKDVTATATFSGFNSNVAGDQTITVSYSEGSVSKETTYQVHVNYIDLAQPSLSFDEFNKQIKWDNVEHASGYNAKIGDEEFASVTSPFDIPAKYIGAGEQTFTLTAVGTGNYASSVNSIDFELIPEHEYDNEIDLASITYDDNTTFLEWSSTYAAKEYTGEYTKLSFTRTDKQGSTITNMPVVNWDKDGLDGDVITFAVNEGSRKYISGFRIDGKQWTNKAQTITLSYSLDGESYVDSTEVKLTSSTNGITFKVECAELPENVVSVKLHHSAKTSNVGYSKVYFDLVDKPKANKTLVITETLVEINVDNTYTPASVKVDNVDVTGWVLSVPENDYVEISNNSVVALLDSGDNTVTVTVSKEADLDNIYASATFEVKVVTPQAPTYELTFGVSEGVDGDVPASGSYIEGYEVTLPGKGSLDKTGYSFVGWTDGEETYTTTYVMPANAVQLTAVFEANDYHVTYNANGATAGNVPVDSNTYNIGNEITVASQGDLVKEYFEFGGWAVNGTPVQGSTYTCEDADIEFVAIWDEYNVTVSYDLNGASGEMESAAIKVEENNFTVVDLAASVVAPEGKYFAGWEDSKGVEHKPGDVMTITSDLELIAKWADIAQIGEKDTYDFDAEASEYVVNVNSSTIVGLAKGNGGSTPKYYSTGDALRVYGGNTMTISSDKEIACIKLNFGVDDQTNLITSDVGFISNGCWYGCANSVTFTILGTKGHRRISSLEISYALVESEMAKEFENLDENTLPLEGASVVFEEAVVVQGKAMVTASDNVLMTVKAEEGKTITGLNIDLACDYTVYYKKVGAVDDSLTKLCEIQGNVLKKSVRPGSVNGNNIELPDDVGEVVVMTENTSAVELKALSVESQINIKTDLGFAYENEIITKGQLKFSVDAKFAAGEKGTCGFLVDMNGAYDFADLTSVEEMERAVSAKELSRVTKNTLNLGTTNLEKEYTIVFYMIEDDGLVLSEVIKISFADLARTYVMEEGASVEGTFADAYEVFTNYVASL